MTKGIADCSGESNPDFRGRKKCLLGFVLLLSLIGLADAAFLTYTHYLQNELACSAIEGCDVVTTSSYATFFAVPVAFLGVLYYAAMLPLAAFAFKREKLLRLLVFCTAIGFLATLWFIYVQAFVLNVFCPYCIVSAGAATGLFAIGVILWKKNKNHAVNPTHTSQKNCKKEEA